jgi:glucokinase
MVSARLIIDAESPQAVIGVDVGGTSIKAALCDRNCTMLDGAVRSTPAADGAEAVLAAICATVEELAGRATDRRLAVARVGLVMPGVLDPAAGLVRYSANLPWRELPIAAEIAGRVGLPVAIEHDVRAAGLAEARLGAARDVPDALYVSIGTGIAAASVVGGQLVTGSSGLAGEIGHQPVLPGGEPCGCGQRGCAEAYASAAAISRRYQARAGRPATAAEVIERAGAGDPVAGAVFGEAVDALAHILIGCVLLLDPGLIVLGGGLALAGDALLQPLAERLRTGLAWRGTTGRDEPTGRDGTTGRDAPTGRDGAPPLRTARFGDQAGRIGAALIGWQAVDGRPASGR